MNERIKQTKNKQESLIPELLFREIIKENSEFLYGRKLSEKDIIPISEVLNNTQRAKKYPKHSWCEVEPSLYVDACVRHQKKIDSGEDNDSESGLPHGWHLACNIMFLLYFEMIEYGYSRNCFFSAEENSKLIQEYVKRVEKNLDFLLRVETEQQANIFEKIISKIKRKP